MWQALSPSCPARFRHPTLLPSRRIHRRFREQPDDRLPKGRRAFIKGLLPQNKSSRRCWPRAWGFGTGLVETSPSGSQLRSPARKLNRAASQVALPCNAEASGGTSSSLDGKAPRLEGAELLVKVHELSGRDLVCWCAPRACHDDLLSSSPTASARSIWSPPSRLLRQPACQGGGATRG